MKHARSGSTFFVLACDSTFEFIYQVIFFADDRCIQNNKHPNQTGLLHKFVDLIYFFETFANFAMPLKNMSTVMLLSLQRYGLKY